MRKADLHIHTNASDDASLDPEWIFARASDRRLAALAFTDHEGMAHWKEGRRLSRQYGVAFLPGIEISSLWKGEMAHLLGYFPHGVDATFERFLTEGVWAERRRVQLTLLKHLQGQGVPVTVEEYEAEAQAGRAGTFHMPLYRLLRRKGIVADAHDYLEVRRSANIRLSYPPVPVVISAVHVAGGIAVLAHPGAGGDNFYDFAAEDIVALAGAGLDGLEVSHRLHDHAMTEGYARLADELGLLKTGGSDIHHESSGDGRGPGDYTCDWDAVLRHIA